MSRFIRWAAIPMVTVAALAVLEGRAEMQRPVVGNAAGIRGVWYPHRTEKPLPGAGWKLELSDSNLAITHARATGEKPPDLIDIVRHQVEYRIQTNGSEQRLVPTKDNLGVSTLKYHIDGDRLMIDEGSCAGVSLKGEWRHTPPKQ